MSKEKVKKGLSRFEQTSVFMSSVYARNLIEMAFKQFPKTVKFCILMTSLTEQKEIAFLHQRIKNPLLNYEVKSD